MRVVQQVNFCVNVSVHFSMWFRPPITDGVRIAASNTIESLMENDFHLVINDVVHRVDTPPRERMSQVSAAGFSGSTHDRSQQHQHQDPSSHAEDEGADLGKSIMQMNGREL